MQWINQDLPEQSPEPPDSRYGFNHKVSSGAMDRFYAAMDEKYWLDYVNSLESDGFDEDVYIKEKYG